MGAATIEKLTTNKSRFDKPTAAMMLAGMCTFLNVYCTQPLLPMLRRTFGASELEVTLTVSATILATALTAPFIGMIAELRGRKKVIVPSLFLLTVPTALAATSSSLDALIFWRFAQGLFVPGVIAVMLAYVNEEWAGRGVGRAMSAYVTGTVIGGFLGRFLSGVIAEHWHWQNIFLVLAGINLIGAMVVRAWLPLAKNFVRAEHARRVLGHMLEHVRNPRLLANFGTGAAALFALVGCFTYANFYLSRAAFSFEFGATGQHLLCISAGSGDNAAIGAFSRSLRLSPHCDLLLLHDDHRIATDAGEVAAGGDRWARHFFVGSVYRAGGGHGANGSDCRTLEVFCCRALRNFLLSWRKRRRHPDRLVLAVERMARLRRFTGGSDAP